MSIDLNTINQEAAPDTAATSEVVTTTVPAETATSSQPTANAETVAVPQQAQVELKFGFTPAGAHFELGQVSFTLPPYMCDAFCQGWEKEKANTLLATAMLTNPIPNRSYNPDAASPATDVYQATVHHVN